MPIQPRVTNFAQKKSLIDFIGPAHGNKLSGRAVESEKTGFGSCRDVATADLDTIDAFLFLDFALALLEVHEKNEYFVFQPRHSAISE